MPTEDKSVAEKLNCLPSKGSVPLEQVDSKSLDSTGHAAPCSQQNPQEDYGVINWGHLVGLLGDETTVMEIMPEYLKHIKKHFDQLTVAVEQRIAEEIRSHAHALKGVGRNLGSKSLLAVGLAMERAGEAGQVEAAVSMYSVMETEIGELVAFLSKEDWPDLAKHQASGNSSFG